MDEYSAYGEAYATKNRSLTKTNDQAAAVHAAATMLGHKAWARKLERHGGHEACCEIARKQAVARWAKARAAKEAEAKAAKEKKG